MGQPFSLRLSEDVRRRLDRRAERSGIPARTLAQRYVDEGVRRDDHPLIRFADGPSGRRAALVTTGLDVWQVIEVVRENDGDAGEAAAYLQIPRGLVDAAVTYYGAFREEIDARIDANRRALDEGYAEWRAGRRAIAG